jgi:hypothetical protein
MVLDEYWLLLAGWASPLGKGSDRRVGSVLIHSYSGTLMQTGTPVRRRSARTHSNLRAGGWLASGLLVAVATLGPSAGLAAAASVAPVQISSGNPTCDDVAGDAASWTEFKLQDEQLADGTYSDGVLTITITSFAGSASGVPGSFDWAASEGIDAVFVKAGSERHHLYVYDPEAIADSGLQPQAGRGNGISHLSFCYDRNPADEQTETPGEQPTEDPSEQPTDDPSEQPTDDPSEGPFEGGQSSIEATPSPTGAVLSATGVPAVTLPPTDTDVDSTAAPSMLGWRLVLIGLAALIAALLLGGRRVAIAVPVRR